MHTRSLLVLACVIASTQAATTVVDVVKNSTDHTTLLALVTRAELATALSGTATKFTVFAPSNAAFTAIPAGDLKTKLTADPINANHKALLQDVLKQHVISAATATAAGELPAVATDVVTMSASNPLTLKNVAPQVKAGTVEATVLTADITVDNGIVHVVDKVLFPASCGRTVVGIATGNTNFSTLVALLTAAELVSTLSTDTPNTGFTVFAPTNAAFAKVDAATLACLQLPANSATLINLLKYHVVGSTVVSTDLSDMMEITSLADAGTSKYKFQSTGTTLTPLDGTATKITTVDLLATNGVVHIIDSVLIPKGFVCPAAPSSSASSSAITSLASVALAAAAAMAI